MNKNTMKKISTAVLLAVAAISAQGQEMMPDFHKIKVHGKTGYGIVSKHLKAKGTDLKATEEDHDSQLIDSSNMTHEETSVAIASALHNNKAIIVDGDDTPDSSAKLKKIMDETVGFSIEGATAYMIHKTADGHTAVTPIQSLNNKTGVRKIDQLDKIFSPRH